jgi:hypothetical protein
VKRPEQALLARLDEYADSILIAGCQRSGTTALARLFKRAEGIADFAFGPDDELDAALLLAGYIERRDAGRHCFQTTYLNDRYPEYFEHDDFRLIWVLREPRSVVYSMLYNWKRDALERLFAACGAAHYSSEKARPALLGSWLGPSRLDKACASYVAKTEQTFVLRERLGERMAVVDYDELVAHREEILPRLFEFANTPFDRQLLRHLHGNSVNRGNRLGATEAAHVDKLCMDVYQRARALRTIGIAHAGK